MNHIDLRFQNWELVLQRASVRQYDDRAHLLRVTGDLPEGWTWKLCVSVFGETYFNSIPLAASDGALTAVLTRDDLAFGDAVYTLQLVGEQGEATRHTNPVRLYVGASLSGDGVWPEVPASFTAAQRAAESAAAAAAASAAEAADTAAAIEADFAPRDAFAAHTADAVAHVTAAERAAWNAKADAASLAAVATSGRYADLTGKPTNLSDFSNDMNYVNSTDLADAIQTAVGDAGDLLARSMLTMVLANSTVYLDLSGFGGIGRFANLYMAGKNALFLLPAAFITGQQSYDALSFSIVAANTDANGIMFAMESVWDGKRYFVVLTPEDENLLSGPLVVTPQLPAVSAADNGKVLRVANGAWTAAALPSAEGVRF